MKNPFVLALSTIVGITVGAGIFGIPYIVERSGIIPSILYFGALGGATMLIQLFLGEVCLRTTEKFRLIGYASKYLGVFGKIVATISTFIGIVGALLVYIILAGTFLHIVLEPVISLPNSFLSLVFWGVLSFFIFRNVGMVARAGFFINMARFLAIGIIFWLALPHVKLENISLFDGGNVFLPYGVILFSLAGWVAIPEIAELFKGSKEKRRLDNAIMVGSVLVVTLYVAFSLIVVGVSGKATSQDALSGLTPFLGQGAIVFGALFGVFAVSGSFLVLGSYLKNSLTYDLKLPRDVAGFLTILLPLGLFLFGVREFIPVVGVLGTWLGFVEALLIMALFWRARKRGDRKPEYEVKVPRILPVLAMLLIIGGALVGVLFP